MIRYSFKYLLFNNRDFSKHDGFVKIFGVITIPITWVFLNFTSLGPNAVTAIGFSAGLIGSVLGYLYNLKFLLIGFMVFYVCDYMDGNIAIAKGGGTFLGNIFDFMTDRIVLFSSSFVLLIKHFEYHEELNFILLLVFLLMFLLLDLAGNALLKAKFEYGLLDIQKETKTNNSSVKNNFKEIFSDPWIWFPTRISSYLFIISVYLITTSYSYAYTAGIFSVISAIMLRLKDKLRKKLKNGEGKG